MAHNPPVRNGISVWSCQSANGHGVLADAYNNDLTASRRGWQAGHVRGMKIGRRFPPSGQDVRVLDDCQSRVPMPMHLAPGGGQGLDEGRPRSQGAREDGQKSLVAPSWPVPTSHRGQAGQAVARFDSDPTRWLPLVPSLPLDGKVEQPQAVDWRGEWMTTASCVYSAWPPAARL